jgi:hypothetical protein
MATLKSLTVNDTGFIKLPSGTIAQRPSSPSNNMMRFNTDLGCNEMYSNGNWMDQLTGGPAVIKNGLVLHLDAGAPRSYPGSGTLWRDLSGSGLNASGTAANITSSGAISGASWTTSSTSILNTDTHSIFFMLKLNSSGTYPEGYTGSWEKIFTYAPAGTDRSPGVWRYPSERKIHWRYDPGNSDIDFSSTARGLYPAPGTPFALNTWYYIGVTKNGATATAYVNGQSLGSSTVSNPKTSGNATVIINESYTSQLNNINSVVVYNRVLTATEVLHNFNSIKSRFGL